MGHRKGEGMHDATTSDIEMLNRYKETLVKACAIYDRKFLNKRVTYITKSKTVSLVCKRNNFMHLCGIDYYNENPSRFYYDCKRDKLNFKEHHVRIKNDGNTPRKLQVIGCLGDLLIKGKVRLVDNTITYFSNYNYVLRSHSAIIGLGCSWGKNSYYPKSVLNLKFEQFDSGEEIIDILIENLV